MATYLKRTSKLFDLSLSRTFTEVTLRDLMCPVCRGILIEPVTLPCTHNLCLRCLKGTFEHNSLCCPLCRVRVGSWLRTATKSETLVNNELWELIRNKFPKEVEDKHNSDDGDIVLDAGFSTTNKILSAAGEIRREYEAQLQMAEEEIRRQREAEQIASEAFIHKIQREEQQQLAQLAHDQLLAKTLAKTEVAGKQKEVNKFYNDYLNAATVNCSHETQKFVNKQMPAISSEASTVDGLHLENRNANLSQVSDSSDLRRSNVSLMSKIRTERYAPTMKPNASNTHKASSLKFCCQKPMPVYNSVTRTLKHQAVTKFTQPSTSNYSVEPGCSTSKIYGTQSKEELHVPSDVLSSKKKSLGVEVCMTVGNDDERIGSAESAGSHDSINQEIHHFKPIKAMPRTPLKISTDGKLIDPKLIRVVPILKRVSNVVPKPPTPTQKRIIGCSWSAFRGKARQDLKVKESLCNFDGAKLEVEEEPSTSYIKTKIVSVKTTKSQVHDTIYRLDLEPEVSFDNNKNFTKNIHRIMNGTKVSKKLILDESTDLVKIPKAWITQLQNGSVLKCEPHKSTWIDKKDIKFLTDIHDAELESSTLSFAAIQRTSQGDAQRENCKDNLAVESIAERIKRRKESVDKKSLQSLQNEKLEHDVETVQKSSRKRSLSEKRDANSPVSQQNLSVAQKRLKTRFDKSSVSRTKRQKACRITQLSVETPEKRKKRRKSMRNIKLGRNNYKSKDQDITHKKSSDSKCNYSSSEMCSKNTEYISANNNTNNLGINIDKSDISDESVIREQERMERLVLQEKKDFEYAQILQAKFDEIDRIAGRTRQSKKAIENGNTEIDLFKIKVERSVYKTPGTRTAKQSAINQTMSSETEKRGRPRKRVK